MSFRKEDSTSTGTEIGTCSAPRDRLREAGADLAAEGPAGASDFLCKGLSLAEPAFDWSLADFRDGRFATRGGAIMGQRETNQW